MIVRKLEEVVATERDVDAPNWNSRRLLLARDGLGFSLHDTIIRAGTATSIWYKHHVEAVYCIEGDGELEDLDNGVTYRIKKGTMYAPEHEKHILRAHSEMRLICVFNPALTGAEVHDADGVYPLVSEAANG